MPSRSHTILQKRTRGKKFGVYPTYIRTEAKKIDRAVRDMHEELDNKRYRGAIVVHFKKWLACLNLWDLEERYGGIDRPYDDTDLDHIDVPSLLKAYLDDMEKMFSYPIDGFDQQDSKDFNEFFTYIKFCLLKHLGQDYLFDNKFDRDYFRNVDFLREYGHLIKREYLRYYFFLDEEIDAIKEKRFSF